MLLTQRAKAYAKQQAEIEAQMDVLPAQIVQLQEQVTTLQTQVAKHKEAFNQLVSTLNSFSYQDYKLKNAIKLELSNLYSQMYFTQVD